MINYNRWHFKRYTNANVQYIKQHFATTPSKEIAIKLGRTRPAIDTFAKKLGLKKDPAYISYIGRENFKLNNKLPIYTDAEEAYIRQHFACTKTQEIADAIGRTRRSVIAWAHRNGVKKDKDFISKISRFARSGSQIVGYIDMHVINNDYNRYPNNYDVDRPSLKVGDVVRRANGLYVKLDFGKYKRVSQFIWEQHHGPIPSGHTVYFNDRNNENCRIDNLILVPKHIVLELNHMKHLPMDLQQAMYTLREVKRRIIFNNKKANT